MAARLRRRKFADATDETDEVCLYDIEFSGAAAIGIQFETDFYGNHAIVKAVESEGAARNVVRYNERGKPTCIVQKGHIVVAVNGKDVSNLPFQEVMLAIKATTGATSRVLRFLDPNVLPLDQMNHRAADALLNCDNYGFAKDDEYFLQYRKHLRLKKAQPNHYAVATAWVEFLQTCGGLDGLDAKYNRSGAFTRAEVKVHLEPLILRGIPTAFRASIWGILTNVSGYKAAFPRTHYADLLHGDMRTSMADDIDKDVGRTYPEHAYFQETKGKQELTNVLVAYSMHNTAVGYCQSMNFLVGILLLFHTEEEAFWLLCVMMAKCLPMENYSRSMLGAQVDQVVFKRLVALQLPAIAEAFDNAGIAIELVTLQWFLCVFVCTLPLDTALRVWDYMFLQGEQVLFAAALAIIKAAESKIMEASPSHISLLMIIRDLGLSLHDADGFMSVVGAFSPSRHRNDSASKQPSSDKPNHPFEALVQKFNEFTTKVRKPRTDHGVDDCNDDTKGFQILYTFDDIQRWRREIRPEIEAAAAVEAPNLANE
ncbi:hypothetical protein, variant 1 [Aphanomyces invadans]|uniref:Rab-GAP TBC domain-containing protein n=1 Tax=Aphanomyces invadans TaxID=157072 RepID=A0A024UUY0_9STRA|nr:hypothetical protein, variant 1 [Aphanomyces invadans]ETW10326.1 hypothetical protein, variant 1 [Aphanomyces invadans]|eukprot:XP_008861740.1 hypothetical protein, variant 1 [Aphanomyces invadans]